MTDTITALTGEQKAKVLNILRLNGPIDHEIGDIDELADMPRAALRYFLKSKPALEAAAEGKRTLDRLLSEDSGSPEDYDPEDPALPALGLSEEDLQGLRIYKRD